MKRENGERVESERVIGEWEKKKKKLCERYRLMKEKSRTKGLLTLESRNGKKVRVLRKKKRAKDEGVSIKAKREKRTGEKKKRKKEKKKRNSGSLTKGKEVGIRWNERERERGSRENIKRFTKTNAAANATTTTTTTNNNNNNNNNNDKINGYYWVSRLLNESERRRKAEKNTNT